MDVLNFWQDDPEELLLDLGFGAEEPDISVRIPARFINHPSQARGIDVQVFLQAQQNRIDIENPDVRNRFRQIEVLQQVTTAFSSLVGVSAPSAAKPVVRPVSEESRERRRRVGMLFRKASKKSLSQRANLRNQQLTSPLADSSFGSELPADSPLDKRILMRRASLSPLIEEQTPFSEGAEPTEPNPPQDKGSSSRGGRELKNGTSTTVSSTYRSPGQMVESFELEEIQSFDEGTTGSYASTAEGFHPVEVKPALLLSRSINGNDRPCLSWVGSCLVRTNSCQSDSSGFQEEPFVPANPSPGPELMKVLNAMSGDSTDGQHKSLDLQDPEALQSPCSEDHNMLFKQVEPSATDSEGITAHQTDCLVNVVQKDLPGQPEYGLGGTTLPKYLVGRPEYGKENATQLKDLPGLQGYVGENDTLQKDLLSRTDCVKEGKAVEKDRSSQEGGKTSRDLQDQYNYGGENSQLQEDLSGLRGTSQKEWPGHHDYTSSTKQKDSPNPPWNTQVHKQKSVETLMNIIPKAGVEHDLLSCTDSGGGGESYAGRSVSVQMRSKSQASLKGSMSLSGPTAGEKRRDSFLRGDDVEKASDLMQTVSINHPSPELWLSQNSSRGVRRFGQCFSSQDMDQSFEEDSRWRATLSGAQRLGYCHHKIQGRGSENENDEGQDQRNAATKLPYSMEELAGMMRCMWRFRKMISEIEEQLEEEQSTVLDSLSQEHRTEVQSIMELRMAVKQEAGLLEQQLGDLLQAYDDTFKMKMNRLLDEQSHLCTELRFTCRTGHTPKRSVGVQCSILTDTSDNSTLIQDGGWSPGGKADKLNFVGFIRSLKDESENDSEEIL